MFTWVLDYMYSFIIVSIAFFVPLYIYFFYKNIFINKNKLLTFIGTFFLVNVLIIFLLWLKSFHLDYIYNICFDYPSMTLKNINIPSGCYNFDYEKYDGVGWPLTAIFWMILIAVYLILLNILYLILNKFKGN